jgi:hypothetical protein
LAALALLIAFARRLFLRAAARLCRALPLEALSMRLWARVLRTFVDRDNRLLDEGLDRALDGAVASATLQALTVTLLLRLAATLRANGFTFLAGLRFNFCHDLSFSP